MGAQSPPHMLCFITVCVTAAISIIALALSGTLTNVYGYCRVGSSTTCGGPAVGITAGVLGMLIAGLAIAWLIIAEVWYVGILRFVLVGGFALVAIFAFVSGVILAYLAGTLFLGGAYGNTVAASVFQFFLMLCAAGSALFCFMAGGGGTSSA
jgi:hypothetical protein